MGCTGLIARFRRSRFVPATAIRVPMQTTPAISLRSRSPGPPATIASGIALVDPVIPSLWEQALTRLHPDDTKGVNFQATNKPSQLLHNLIDATEQKKAEMEAKEWVYIDDRGERASYADKFLTVLNKYVGILDIAISHDPHVAALVWAGFRLLLQVGLPFLGLSGINLLTLLYKVATADRLNVKMIFGGLEVLVRILFRCDIYEKLYGKRSLQATEQLNTSLVHLYVAVLQYLCSARRQLSLDTKGTLVNGIDKSGVGRKPRLIPVHLVRILKSLVSDSGDLFKKILDCEIEVQKDAEIAEKEGLNPNIPQFGSN